MKWLVLIARVILGLGFVVFGLSMFIQFLPMDPPPMPEAAKSFSGALYESKFLHVVKVLEILGGAMVLTGLYLPLGLTILTPILVNICLFDLLLMGKPGLGTGLLLLAIFLIWAYRSHFAAVFARDAKIGS